jgi:hypothetical protein
LWVVDVVVVVIIDVYDDAASCRRDGELKAKDRRCRS